MDLLKFTVPPELSGPISSFYHHVRHKFGLVEPTSRWQVVAGPETKSRATVDGYGWFGLDEGEEMWLLELVTLVSVPQRQSRGLFLFEGRQNERVVLYTESGVDQLWTRHWSRAQLGLHRAPPGQGLLPAALTACLPQHFAASHRENPTVATTGVGLTTCSTVPRQPAWSSFFVNTSNIIVGKLRQASQQKSAAWTYLCMSA